MVDNGASAAEKANPEAAPVLQKQPQSAQSAKALEKQAQSDQKDGKGQN